MAVLEHFKTLSEERFLALYQALSERGFGPLDHEVAKLLRFRPQAIKKIPMESWGISVGGNAVQRLKLSLVSGSTNAARSASNCFPNIDMLSAPFAAIASNVFRWVSESSEIAWKYAPE